MSKKPANPDTFVVPEAPEIQEKNVGVQAPIQKAPETFIVPSAVELGEDLQSQQGVPAVPPMSPQVEENPLPPQDELAKEKRNLEIEDKIVAIQRSTKVTFQPIAPIHNALRQRFKWYYKWHLNPFASLAHIGVVVTTVLLIFAVAANSLIIKNPHDSYAMGDNTAINVLGQLDGSNNPVYTTNYINGGANSTGMYNPTNVLVDSTDHRLFVSDFFNNRVLVYNLDSSNILVDYTADYVLGQPDLISNSPQTTQARLSGPRGLAYDTTGKRLFVSDYSNNRVMVYDVASISNGENAINVLGQTSFTAGASATTQGRMYGPYGLAYDSVNSKLFVSEYINHRVMVFDVTSISNGENAVNILGKSSYTDATSASTQSRLYYPCDLAYDNGASVKRLFVVDRSNHRVMVWDVTAISDGENAINVLGQTNFTNVAAANTQGGMNAPYGVAFEPSTSRLFVSQNGNSRTTVYDVTAISDGENAINVLGQTTFTATAGGITQAKISYPCGMDISGGLLYTSDYNNNRVIVNDVAAITDGENAVNEAGQLSSGSVVYTQNDSTPPTTDKVMDQPRSTTIDSTGHRLFVADSYNNRVLVYNLDSNNLLVDRVADYVLGQSTFATRATATTQAGLYTPSGLAYDSVNSRLFVADTTNNRVIVYDVTSISNGENAVGVIGQSSYTLRTAATSLAGMSGPMSVAYDSANTRLFVSDGSNQRITVYNVATIDSPENAINVLGQSSFTTSAAGTTQSTLYTPRSLLYDGTSKLYVSDYSNYRVLIFDVTSITDGENAINVLGQTNFTNKNSAVTQSGLTSNWGLAYDTTNKRLFVSDFGNSRIMIYDVNSISDGENAINVIGQSNYTTATVGTSQTKLNLPAEISYDSTSNMLYIPEYTNNRVLVISAGTTRYWINSAGGNWNDTANWSYTSNGVGGATVPANGDSAIFDGAGGKNGNLTINANISVGTLDFRSGYSGTVTSGSYTITTADAMNLTGASLTAGADITANGTLSIGSSKTLDTVGHNITITGTFTNNGTLKRTGAETATFTNDAAHGTIEYAVPSGSFNIPNISYFGLKLNGSSVTFNQPASAFTTNGPLNLAAGTYVQGANDLTVKGNLTIAASSATFTKGTGSAKLILAGDLTFSGPATPQDLGYVQIGASPDTTTLASDFSATTLTIPTGDILNTHGYEVTISGDISVTGTLDTTDNGGGGYEGDGSTITTGGHFTINSGGTFTKCTQASRRSLLKMNSGATRNLTSGGDDLGDFQVSTSSTQINLQDALTAESVTLDSSTTLNNGLGSYTLNISGNWSNSGIYNIGTSTTNFTKSSGTQTLNSGGSGLGHEFNAFNHSGAGTLQLATNTLSIVGTFTNSSGVIDGNGQNVILEGNLANTASLLMGSGTWTVYGNVDFTGGTVTASSSTLVMGGSYNLVGNGQTLNNLKISTGDPAVPSNSTKSAGTGVDDSSFGNMAWSNPSNITASDTVYASVSTPGPIWTHYLKSTSHGFSIPSDATIYGIEASVTKKAANVAGFCTDYRVSIAKADGSIGTTDKKAAGNWVTTDTVTTYGNSSELWGETWTPTAINDTDFGLAFSASVWGNMGAMTCYVDYVSIKVYYTASSSDTVTVTDNVNIGGTLTTDSGQALSINTTKTVTMNAGSTTTLNGTISGAGTFELKDSAGANLSAGGTLSAVTRFTTAAANVAIPVRTYGAKVEIYNGSASNYSAVLGTGASQTLSFSSDLNLIAAGNGNITADSDTYDPSVNIVGNLDYTGAGGGTEIITAGNSTWTVTGNVDFTAGTFTAGTSTLKMNGNANLVGAGQTLYNFRVAGTETPTDTGWRSAGTGADDASVGVNAWGNYANITADDTNYAVASITTTFGPGSPTDSNVKLVKSGSVTGNSEAQAGTWSDTEATILYPPSGGNSDLWGATLSDTDINSSNFGVAISAYNGATITHYLKATNFGFSIPTGDTINGVEANIKRKGYVSMGIAYVNFIQMKVYYMAVTGNITVTATDNINVSHLSTVDSGQTLSVASGKTVTMTSGSTTTDSGTISGSGTLNLVDTAGANLSTSGTLSSIARFTTTAAGATVPARTYGGNVEFYTTSASNYSIVLGTATSQSLTFSGNFTPITNSTGTLTIDSDTFDPTVNITGSIAFTKTSSGVPSITAGNSTWNIVGSANFTNGTLTSNTSTFSFNGADSSTQVITGSVSFFNLSASTASNAAGRTIQFAGNSTTMVTNNWIVTGYSGKVITLGSTDTNAWTINPATSTVTYTSVARSTNSGAGFCASYSTDGSNNTNWHFSATATCTGVVTISGTVYTNEAKSANIGTGKSIGISINGGGKSTAATNGSGQFSATVFVTTNNTVTVFIDNDASLEANLITQAVDATSNITGLELYTDKIILRHESAGPLTNSLLDTANNCVNCGTDIHYATAGSAATFEPTFEVWVDATKNYTPGGAVTLGDLDVNGTLAMAANALNISSNFDATGGTFTSSGTTTFTATTTGKTIVSASQSFSSLTFDGVGGGWGFSDAASITGNLTVTNSETAGNGVNFNNQTIGVASNMTMNGGKLTAGSSTITVGGNWDNSGDTFVANTSTVDFMGSGTVNNGPQYFYNVKLAHNGQTTTLASAIYLNNILNTYSGGVLTGAYVVYLYKSDGDPFIDTGATLSNSQFHYMSTQSITVSGHNFPIVGYHAYTNDVAYTLSSPVSASSYIIVYSLTAGKIATLSAGSNNISTVNFYLGATTYAGAVDFGSGTHTLTGTLSRNPDTTSVTNTINLGSSNTSIGGNIDFTGITVTPGTSTVNMTAGATGKTITSGAQAFNNLTFNGVGGGWTFQDATNVNGNFTITAGTVVAGATTITVAGDWELGAGGVFTYGTSTVSLIGTGNINLPNSSYFYNLSVASSTKTSTINTTSHYQVINTYGALVLNGGTLTRSSTSNASVFELRSSATPVSFISPTAILNNPMFYFKPTAAGTVYVPGGNYGGASLELAAEVAGVSYSVSGAITTTSTVAIQSNITGAVFNTNNYTITASSLYFPQGNWSMFLAGTGTLNCGSSTFNLANVSALGTNMSYQPVYTIDMGSSTWNVSGIWTNKTAATTVNLTSGTSTVNMTAGATGKTITSNSQTFHDLIFNNAAGGWSFVDAASITGNLTIATSETVGNGVNLNNQAINVDGNVAINGGKLTAGSSAVTVGGNWSRASGTFVANTSTITFDATTSGKTITTGAQSFSSLAFNGSGGGWTLQDNLTAAAATLTLGTLVDNAKTVTVNGNISVVNAASLLTSTGSWIQGASGTISNPNTSNPFKNLTIAGSGVTTTMAGAVLVGYLISGGGNLTLGLGTLNGAGYSLSFYSTANDALTVNSLIMGTALGAFTYTIQGAGITQKAITIPNGFATWIYLKGGIQNWAATGDFNFGTNAVMIDSGVTTVPTTYLDMSSHNLTCGTLNLGYSVAGRNGYLKLGSGTHSIGSIAIYAGSGTGNILDLGTSNTSISGNVDFTGITVTPGTATVTMTATTTGRTITSASQSFPNLVFNGSGGGWTLQDNLTSASLTITAGNLIDNAKTLTINGDISVGNTASLLTSTGTWIQGASGNLSNPNTSDSFRNLSIAGTGVVTTFTDSVCVGSSSSAANLGLTIGSGHIAGASKNLYLYSYSATDTFTIGTPTIDSALNNFTIYNYLASNLTLNAHTFPTSFATTFRLSTTSGNIVASGDLNLGNGGLYVTSTATTSTVPSYYLDMSSSSLITTGTLYLGYPNNNGYLKLGTSTSHSIGGNLSASGTGTASVLDMGSSTVAISGNTNFTNITVTPGTSTVNMTATATGKTITSASQAFKNLTFNNAGGGWSFSDAASITGNLTITTSETAGNGVNLNNQAITVGGNIAINGGELTAGSSVVTIGGAWTRTGIFNCNTSEVKLSPTTVSSSISADNSFYKLTMDTSVAKTVTFEAAKTQTVSNTWAMSGTAAITDLTLVSSTPGTAWKFSIPAAFTSGAWIDVKDSQNTANTNRITPSANVTDSGNNTPGWIFASNGTVAGSLYDNIGGALIMAAKTIKVSINGTAASSATSASGSFTVNLSQVLAANDVVTVYVSGDAVKASTLTKVSATGGLVGFDLYQAYTTIRHEGSIASIVNTDLATADNLADTDILLSADGSNNATYTQGLYILAAKTYAPGANITTPGSWYNAGTFTPGAYTATFTAAATGKTINSGTGGFYNIVFNNAAGGWQFNDTTAIAGTLTVTTSETAGNGVNLNNQAIDINGNVVLTAGKLTAGSAAVTVGGSWTRAAGTFVCNTSTVTFDATGTGKTITAAGGAFNSLIFNGTGGGWTLQDNLTTANITATAGNLTDNAKTVTVNGNIDFSSGVNVVQGSSGVWITNANGNITGNASNWNNTLYDYRVADGVTATRAGANFSSRKLTLGNSSSMTGNYTYVLYSFWGNDPLDMAATSSISGGAMSYYTYSASVFTQKAFNANISINFGYTASSTVRLTGNITVGGAASVYGGASSTSEATSFVLDTNGFNLTVGGDLGMNYSGQDWRGKILFGSGTHSIGGQLYTRSTTGLSYVDLGSANISVAGNINFTYGTVTPGTSTVNMTAATTGKTITSASQAFKNLTFNNAAGGWSFVDAASITGNLTITTSETAGNGVNFNNQAINVDGNIAIGGGKLTAGSSTVTAGGSWTRTSGTFVANTSTITFDATGTGKTITSGAQAFNNLTFNGSGGGWTLQDNLTATTVTGTAGTLVDNAKTVTVNGDILFANVNSTLLTSTGTWVQGANGSIYNGNPAENGLNKINIFQVAAGVTSTIVDHQAYDLPVKKIIVGASATLTGNASTRLMIWSPSGNDFIDLGTSAVLSPGSIDIVPNGNATQKAFSTSSSITIHNGVASTIQMTGAWTTGSLVIYGNPTSSEALANVVDTTNQNLTVNGSLTLGASNITYPNGYHGKIIFGSGTHTISGNLAVAGQYTHGYFDLSSANISVGGNINYTYSTVTPGTSTVIMTAAATGKTIASASQSFSNLTFNNAAGGWTMSDAAQINGNFTITTGTVTLPSTTLTVNGNFMNNGGSFIHNSGTVKLTSESSAATLRTNGSSFYNLKQNQLGTGLTGYWKLDEGVNAIGYDSSGNNYNATLYNTNTSTDWVAGKDAAYYGGDAYAADFNGLNAHAGIASNTSLKYTGGNMTLDAWVNPDTSETTGGKIISKPWNGSGQYNYTLNYNTNKTLTLGLVGATSYTGTTTQALTAGSWNHIVVSLDSSKNVKIYIDNSLALSDAYAITDWTPSSGDANVQLAIGTFYPYGSGWAGNTGFSFDGKIDDVRIYNRAVTASEVTTLYNGANPSSGMYTLADDLNVANNLELSSGTFDVSAANYNVNVAGNFTNNANFNARAGTVNLTGTNSSTQNILGNTTFYNLTASTAANSAGRTLQFVGASTTTVSGTWTITGYSGKVITMQSSNTTNWIVNPTTAAVDYATVSRSTDNGVTICATHSTDGSNNNAAWKFTAGTVCNVAPSVPASLAQKKTTDVVISTGSWTTETSVKFTATISDTDNPDTIYLCVEKKALGSAFADTEDSCGSGVAYSGSGVATSVTIGSLVHATQYHWQARVKDAGGLYSAWVQYGGNAESASDFGIDTSNPTGTVNDGTGADVSYNDGSLTQLQANWSITDTGSGIAQYEYAVQRSSDSYYWSSASGWQSGANWVNNGTTSNITVSSMNLHTSVNYYFSVRATDNAGNLATISSNGQVVLPTLSFTIGSNTVNFNNLNVGNNFTDSKSVSLSASTNAAGGYAIFSYKPQPMASTSDGAITVPNFSGTWATPLAWGGSNFGFGYSSSDSSVQGSNRFAGGTLFSGFLSSAPGDIVADHTDLIDGSTGAASDIFSVIFKIAVSNVQKASAYSTKIIYTVTAAY